MKNVNADTWVAIFLLLFCGVFITASFAIRETNFGQMGSQVWPQIILGLLTLLTLLYLGHSLRKPDTAPSATGAADGQSAHAGGFLGWLGSYRNALFCYLLFFLFLVSLPVLGMLIGGVAFVFAMLTVLGENTVRNHLKHLAIAIGAVGAMWAIFTYGLHVILPQGMIFTTL